MSNDNTNSADTLPTVDELPEVYNNVDMARVHELLDTCLGICLRNGWPMLALVDAFGADAKDPTKIAGAVCKVQHFNTNILEKHIEALPLRRMLGLARFAEAMRDIEGIAKDLGGEA